MFPKSQLPCWRLHAPPASTRQRTSPARRTHLQGSRQFQTRPGFLALALLAGVVAFKSLPAAFVPSPGSSVDSSRLSATEPHGRGGGDDCNDFFVDRRELLAYVAALTSGQPVHAVGADWMVKEARKKAAIDAAKVGIFNPNSYKIKPKDMNFSKIDKFLPTIFKCRRSFQDVFKQLRDPKVNLTSMGTFELLREQNRLEPMNTLRKASFIARGWVTENEGPNNTKYLVEEDDAPREVKNAYERLKRALDEEDVGLLLVIRDEDDYIELAKLKQVRRNVQAIIDVLESIIDLMPPSIRDEALAEANAAEIPIVRLPLKDKYRTKEDVNASNVTVLAPNISGAAAR
eukprot:TRINITY_DN124050_c0_g1_i1.p1 TRINITY_DN124050_c0_g1~~TRINITY_DN124050_c0_g1_i1.p1  ORF type:complete len:345 (+),score=68.37 TRINITY_DN124050_c0_g1_i1:130-1164(+)